MSTEPERALENAGSEIEEVIVAVDTSAGAARVLEAATRVIRAFPRATLHVVHVFRTSRLDRAHAGAPVTGSEALQEAKDYLDAHVRAARRQCRNGVTSHFLIGDPASEVLLVCDEVRADLLVVGTHDYVGLERLLLGSIAETLMRKAECSVLVVRPGRSRHS